MCYASLNRLSRSFIESISSSHIFLLDFLQIHQNDALGATNYDDSSPLALCAFEPQCDLLGGLCLFPEDGLGLSPIA